MNERGFSHTLLNKTQDELIFQLEFDSSYQYFEGHFDNFKLLPALIQIHLVVELYKQYSLENLTPLKIQSLKFVKPICPNSCVNLSIKKDESKKSLSFSFTVRDTLYSTGSIQL